MTGSWRPGDLDGFLALALDNLINILLIIGLCRTVLDYPDSLLFGLILPATGISLLVGNLAYANQAVRLARREHRDDCTALPYGINTISLFAYIFLVMLPVKLAALAGGLSEAEAITRSWQAGVMACLGSGLIEVTGAFTVSRLQRWLPRAALLSTLAGALLHLIRESLRRPHGHGRARHTATLQRWKLHRRRCGCRSRRILHPGGKSHVGHLRRRG